MPDRFTCQKCANFSFLRATKRANVPWGVSVIQHGVPTWQKEYKFFKQSSYEMLREISILCYYMKAFYIILDIIATHIICVYVWYIKIVLYFIPIFQVILKKSEEFFFLCFFPFCSFIRNENIKRPGFYTLKVGLSQIFHN